MVVQAKKNSHLSLRFTILEGEAVGAMAFVDTAFVDRMQDDDGGAFGVAGTLRHWPLPLRLRRASPCGIRTSWNA